MPHPREPLVCLLDYSRDRTKEVDPKGYRLMCSNGLVRMGADISGLPCVDVDMRLAGDHAWLRVARLAAELLPDPPKSDKGLIKVNSEPTGVLQSLNDASLKPVGSQSPGSPTDEERRIGRRRQSKVGAMDLALEVQ